METIANTEIYRGLATYMLPDGILDYFDVVELAEADETVNDIPVKVLEVYLDERDNRSAEQRGLRPNGFAEESQVLDFPLRVRKVVLHMRRRRWLTPEGRSLIVDLAGVAREGTRYTERVRGFFKRGVLTPSR